VINVATSPDPEPNPFLIGNVLTDANGDITSWSMEYTFDNSVMRLGGISCSSDQPCTNPIANGPPTDAVLMIDAPPPYASVIYNAGTHSEGTWAETITPEPATFPLLGFGFGLFCLCWRGNLRKPITGYI
jgi:hypothetical protein